jgi:hypothetical protein
VSNHKIALTIYDLKEKQRIPNSFEIESNLLENGVYDIWGFGKNKLLLVNKTPFPTDTNAFIIDIQSKTLRATKFGL